MELLYPAGLLAGLLAIPLVSLYFLRIRRRKVRVPSLLPWHALQRAEKLASPFQRFRRHWLLLAQLLALLALVLALARPVTRSTGEDARAVVVLLDVTASMGALDGSPTRFADASAKIEEILGDLGPLDEVMLILAGPRTEVVVPFTRDPAIFRGALQQVAVTEAEGTLAEAMELALSLARARTAVEIVALTDGSGADLRAVSAGSVPIRMIPVGLRTENAGIVQLDLRRSTSADLSAQLFVAARNTGPQTVPATVEAWLGSELLGVERRDLPPGEDVAVVFELPAAASGAVEVRLEAPGDLLPADDRAWAVVEAAARRRDALVGGDVLTARILGSDPRVKLDRVGSDADLTAYDVVVFGGPVPDGVDGMDYLVLGPEYGGPVKFGDPLDAPRVLGWSRGHPLLRAIRWDGVAISRVSKVLDGGGLSGIVDSDAGPLVLAGERSGGRVAVLAFDPFDSDLPLRVAWPVFVMNAVGWLSGEGAAEGAGVATGQPWIRRVDATSATIDGPSGREEVPVDGGVLRFGDTSRVGVYRVDAGTVKTAFAANLTSARESDITPRRSLPVGTGEVRAGVAGVGRAEWWRTLALVGLAILAIEWLGWGLEGLRRPVAR